VLDRHRKTNLHLVIVVNNPLLAGMNRLAMIEDARRSARRKESQRDDCEAYCDLLVGPHGRVIVRAPAAAEYHFQTLSMLKCSRPPPSVSEVSKITSDMSRLDPSGRDRRRDDPRERYYYENTRRPDPQRSPRYGDDSDPDAEYRRRQMARALSESPSREKGLKMMRGESPEPRRRERPRKPSEYSPSPRTDTIKSANPRAKNRDSQAGASDPQSRYPPPSLRGNRTDDARSNRGPVMSGALPEDGRDGRRNTRDRDPRDEGRRGAKPDWEDRADSRRQHDQEDRRGSRQEARPDRPQEKSRPSDMAASSAAGTSASTRRQVIIDSNGQKRMANVVREGRDKDGRWIEVEEEVEYGSERRRRGN